MNHYVTINVSVLERCPRNAAGVPIEYIGRLVEITMQLPIKYIRRLVEITMQLIL